MLNPRRVLRLWNIITRYWRRFNSAQVPMWAASLAYYATFSLFPLLLLAFAGFGLALTQNPLLEAQVRGFINTGLQTLFPTVFEEISQALGSVKTGALERLKVSAGTSAIIAFVSLVWAASGFFTVLQTALTQAIPGKRSRNAVRQRVVAILSIITLGPLLLLFMLAGLMLSSVVQLPVLEVLKPYSSGFLAMVGASTLFALAYRFLPAHKAGWRASIFAAVPTAAAWQLARGLLTTFTPRSLYEATYGPLTGFVLLLAWLYFSMLLLLSGGVLAGVLESEWDEGRAVPLSSG
jgi:membrane protein